MQAATATYIKANLCSGLVQGTGYFDPGSIHTANMTGLEPSTRYFYIYGSDVISPPSLPLKTESAASSSWWWLAPACLCTRRSSCPDDIV